MSNEQAIADLATALLQGPRGRRLLLEYALASERSAGGEAREDSFRSAVFFASYHLDPGKGSTAVLVGPGAKDVELAVISPEEAAERLREVPLATATSELMLMCLARAVDMARYWQEPDGEDTLAATTPIRHALVRVAEHVAKSADAQWWRTPVDVRSQWSVQWDDMPPTEVSADPLAVLRAARDADVAAEWEATYERPSDPSARWSGEWWSRPTTEVPSSARELFDGSPAGLWLVEDSLGWETATSTRLQIDPGARIYEVDTAEAWAELCRQFPLEQTAQKRHDWYRTTGRNGRWVIPDWAQVAEHYDAVHLHTLAYLSAAGTAIPVDEQTASVIAGWGPDQTYWFTPNVRHLDAPTRWELRDSGEDNIWVRKEA